MIKIDKCYYINLAERSDRKDFIEKEIGKSKILSENFERFEAVNGYKIHPRSLPAGFLSERAIRDILMDNVKAWGLSITQGALGVYLSYISLFEKIKKDGGNYILIEDDSTISSDFDDVLVKIQAELPLDFDLCYLGYGESSIDNINYSQNLVVPSGKITCLPGLIISQAGASKLIDILKNVSSQIDTEIYMKRDKLNLYASKKKITQVKNNLGSNIQGNQNCKKQYKKQNYIFSTLAFGDAANSDAYNLALDLSFFKQKIVIVTDQAYKFELFENVIVVNYPDKQFSYNDKVICFREGLKHEDAVVFLDADFRICYEEFDKTFTDFFVNIEPGFHPSYEWGILTRKESGFFTSTDLPNRCIGYGELAFQISKDLEIDVDKAVHYQESILILSKDNGKEIDFLNYWQEIADRLDAYEKANGVQKLGVGEGNIVGLAVVKSDIKVRSHDWTNFFGANLHHKLDISNIEKGKKIVSFSNAGQIITSEKTSVVFEDKNIDLSYRIIKFDKNKLFIEYEWNKSGAIDLLDHEFKIEKQVYHFNSDKIGNFIHTCLENDIELFHTYDWYGQRSWKKLKDIQLRENKNINALKQKKAGKFKDEGVEIHSLICHKDTALAVNCINSLMRYDEFLDLPIFFHDDGSLTESDIAIIKKCSDNITILDRKTADSEIEQYLINYPNCLKYRLGEKRDVYLWHKIKTFDYYFFSKTKKIIGLDTDILFINKPNQIIDYVNKSIPFYFPDIQSAYCFNEPKDEIPVLQNVNTGIIYIPGSEFYNLDSIENALSNLIRNEINYFPSWIEQSAFAHMFYVDGRYKSLDIQKNRIPFFQEVDFSTVECLHFVSYPAVRALYRSYVQKLDFCGGRIIKEEAFKVKFKEKEIPLRLQIYENDSFYSFEFDWGINSVNINSLSHSFKIKTKDIEELHEFGSNKSGFFLLEKQSSLGISNIEVYHTYDWYGEKSWNKII